MAEGLSFSYDISFDITPFRGVDAAFLSTANTNTGNGLGVANVTGVNFNAIDPTDGLIFSQAGVMNISLVGAPVEPNVTIANFSYDVSLDVLRSANFNETSNGSTLYDGTITLGFGALGSNVMEDGLAAANEFSPLRTYPETSSCFKLIFEFGLRV